MFITTNISQQTGIFASDRSEHNNYNANSQANSIFQGILAKAVNGTLGLPPDRAF